VLPWPADSCGVDRRLWTTLRARLRVPALISEDPRAAGGHWVQMSARTPTPSALHEPRCEGVWPVACSRKTHDDQQHARACMVAARSSRTSGLRSWPRVTHMCGRSSKPSRAAGGGGSSLQHAKRMKVSNTSVCTVAARSSRRGGLVSWQHVAHMSMGEGKSKREPVRRFSHGSTCRLRCVCEPR